MFQKGSEKATAMATQQFLVGHAKEKRNFYKLLTIFFCVDLLIIALICIVAGSLIFHHYKTYIDFADPKYVGVTGFFLVIGIVIGAVAALGIFATVNEKKNALMSFLILVLVLLFMDIIAGSLCLAYRKKVTKAVDRSLNKGIKKYYHDRKDKEFFDWLHEKYDCCGLEGPKDWKAGNKSFHKATTLKPHHVTTVVTTVASTTVNATKKPSVNATQPNPTTSNGNVVNAPQAAALFQMHRIPRSCCITNSSFVSCSDNIKNVYKKGCRKSFEDLITYLLSVVGAIAFACALIMLIGLIVTYMYLKGIEGSTYETI